MSEHTPGPWYRNINPARRYPTIFAGRNKHIATLLVDRMTCEELEANCNLIAAPALLEACRLEDEINDYIESLDLPDDTQHPLWPVVVAMRAARDKTDGAAS